MAVVVKSRNAPRRGEQGYILLILILAVALMAIAAAAIAPELAFQVRRDREEELIHRGVQYSRATRRYYKKFGRYPTRIEELESSNNLRFLRRRYKDPITQKDFRLLHLGDVQMSFGPGVAGAVPAAALASGMAKGGGSAGQQLAMAQQAAAAQQMMAVQQSGSTFSTSPFNSGSSGLAGDAQQGKSSASKTSGNQVFGGGPIVGVTSNSKDQTIREFNSKNHYNEWQFVYDPSLDRGGLLNTPNQKPLQLGGNQKLPQPVAPAVLGGTSSSPAQQNPPAAEPDQQ